MLQTTEPKITGTLRLVGKIEVDSGMILLADPSRADEAKDTLRPPVEGRNPIPLTYATIGGDERDFAVVAPTAYGDGPHAVWVEEENGKPVRMIIELR